MLILGLLCPQNPAKRFHTKFHTGFHFEFHSFKEETLFIATPQSHFVRQLTGRGSLNSLRKFAYSEFPAPLLRRATPVGTRSPYSLPFAILPVPARSPFRFIRHWRRSTPNLTRLLADFTARKRAYSIPSSAVSIASSMFSSFAVSAVANCAFSGWHRALRL